MVIAIDGPSGTGKSTIAKIIAKRLNIAFLNSGSFYRGITLAVQRANIPITDEKAILQLARELKLDYVNEQLILNGENVENLLHTADIDLMAAKVSCIVPLRHIVNAKLREITKTLSVICEGRDITTVVFPNADYKFYIDASIDVQAKRRFMQRSNGETLEQIKQSIIERDDIDKKKAEGALKIAKDSEYIDTTYLTIEQVCEIIRCKIKVEGFNMDQMEVEMNETQSSAGNIQTQLQEEYLKSLETLEEGQLVDGIVIQVTVDQVFIDVGYKSEGKISLSEFSELPKVGDTVSVVLVTKENKHGEVIVSKQKADVKQVWKNLRQAFQDKTPVEGVIEKVVKGGFEVNLGTDIRAFLPISQSDSQKVNESEKLINLKSHFYVERLYSDNKTNIVVNRRKYLEETITANRDAFFENASIGDIVTGAVKSFTSFGSFIDLGGFDGLLHINDMSWGHVTRPKDFVKKGQEITLKVIRLDPTEKRINLSLKHFSEDPWLHFEDKYHVNDIVKGHVTKLAEFGAFIELEEGIEGLVHVSEFSWVRKINKPSDVVKQGDEVECMVLGYDIQAGRVSLGLKQVTANPWETIGEKYPVGVSFTCKVVKLTNAGAFLELEEGIDGFLHVDDISWTKKVKHPGSELTVDQEIEVMIVENDPENHRLRLSLKHLSEDPWGEFAKAHPAGSIIEGEVVSITDFGLFVRVENGIEGLVNKSNLTDNRDEPYEEAVKKYTVGDKISVYVVEINIEKQKAAFSIKEFKKKTQENEISHYMSGDDDGNDGAFTLGDLLKNKNN